MKGKSKCALCGNTYSSTYIAYHKCETLWNRYHALQGSRGHARVKTIDNTTHTAIVPENAFIGFLVTHNKRPITKVMGEDEADAYIERFSKQLTGLKKVRIFGELEGA